MEAKVQRWVQRQGWDRAVSHYQTYWQEQLRPAHEGVLALADLRPGQHVIDIACGTGHGDPAGGDRSRSGRPRAGH